MPESKSMLWMASAMTAVMELAAIIARFGLNLQSTRDTAGLAALTFGYRIHHGYVGVLILIILFLAPRLAGKYRKVVMAFAVALVASDLIHHFIVLWIFTGDPQFDLTY